MLVGLLVVLGYSAAAARRTPVLVAAHNLPAGAVVRASDLRSSRIGADGDVLAALVTVSQEQAVVGRRLAVPVGAGEPLAAHGARLVVGFASGVHTGGSGGARARRAVAAR